MIPRCLSLCFALITFLSAVNSCAQVSSPADPPAQNAILFYDKFIGENSHLYDGGDHAPYDFRIKGSPYFGSGLLLQPGLVCYKQISYPDVPMAYDIVRDELIINRFNQNYRMTLVSEKIAFFILNNHHFVRLAHDSVNKILIATGFYDVLIDGKISFFVKREKKVSETITAEQGDNLWFEEKDLYFIRKDNKYFSVKNKNELFDVFNDKKKEIKRFLRKSKIKFHKEPEVAILKSVEYYQQIKYPS